MKLSEINHFFVFDVESVGLYGEGYAAAYVLIDRGGKVLAEDWFHCDPERAKGVGTTCTDPRAAKQERADRAWYAEHVPALPMTSRLSTPAAVRTALWNAWMHYQDNHPTLHAAAECAWPVDGALLT